MTHRPTLPRTGIKSRSRWRSSLRPALEALEDRTTPTQGSGWVIMGDPFGVGNTTDFSDLSNAIAADAAGNTYVAGRFAYTVDFDPAHANPAAVLSAHPSDDPLMSPQDAFVAKYDPAGHCLWAVDLGGGGQDEAKGVAVDAAGNVAVTGYFSNTASFGPFQRTSQSWWDAFVARLAPDGAVQWVHQLSSGDSYDTGTGVATDAAGNVYAAGKLNNTTFVARFDATADDSAGHNAPAWVAQVGGGGGGIAVDHAGAVVVGGTFTGTADFNPDPAKTYSLSSGRNSAGFVLKLTGGGAFVWADCFQTGQWSGSGVAAVGVDSANNVYAAGNFTGSVDFDPGKGKLTLGNAGGSDVYVAKLTPAGALSWARSMGGSDNDGNYSVALTIDAHDSVYLTGNFYTPTDGSPVRFGSYTVTGHGSEDVFVTKLNSAGTFQWAADMGGAGMDRGYGVAVDGSGQVWVTGFYGKYPGSGPTDFGPADFDPSAGTYLLYGSGAFVAELVQDSW